MAISRTLSNLKNKTNFLFVRDSFRKQIRSFSASNRINVTIDSDGIATVAMANKPVNVLDYDFFVDLAATHRKLESEAKGLILTSTIPKIFSAGNDINEFGNPVRIAAYIHMIDQHIETLYTLKIPTVAAINGAAIGGGCIAAMFCDYRYILEETKIGVNETAFGLPLPYRINKRAKEIVGFKTANQMSLEGTLFDAKEALKVGLVDGVAKDVPELLEMSKTKIRHLLKTVNMRAFGHTKATITSELLRDMRSVNDINQKLDFDAYLDRPQTKNLIEGYMKSLAEKKARKSN